MLLNPYRFAAGGGGALLTGLVSYWKLEEASGTRADSHGTNHLTDNNTVTSGSGKIGVGANFVRANAEYLSRVSNASLQVGGAEFTITAWVKGLVNFSASNQIVTKYHSTKTEYAMLYSNTRFYFYVGAANVLVAGLTPVFGTWYFLVGWFDSSNNSINISVNDGTVNSNVGITPPANNTAEFQIGNRDGQAEYWDGIIDEVGFWKRKLTPAERTELYNAGAGKTYPFT